MPILQIDSLRFAFLPVMAAEKYDEWQHYLNCWNADGGKKAVDIVATRIQAHPATVWLIEAKDFRVINQPPEPANLSSLAQTVAAKVTDTLAGLQDAAERAVDINERTHAGRAIRAQEARIVLHLEPHQGHHSKLFPKNFPAGVFQKLKQLVRHIDSSPLVVDMNNVSRLGLPWAVS